MNMIAYMLKLRVNANCIKLSAFLPSLAQQLPKMFTTVYNFRFIIINNKELLLFCLSIHFYGVCADDSKIVSHKRITCKFLAIIQ